MDVASLTTAHLPTEEVELPNGRGTVTVRSLSRQESLDMRKAGHGSTAEFERHLFALCMVDPPMTVEQVEAWQAASPPGEMEAVGAVLNRMSALNPGAAKEAFKEIAADGEAQFRVPPGGTPGDDGDPAPAGDAG